MKAPVSGSEVRDCKPCVAGPGPLDPGILASVPQAPVVANLDITTLCALVSGLTHGAAHRADAAALALLHKGWFQARGGPRAERSIWFWLELALLVS